MYPSWKTSFDAHINDGRVIELILLKNTEEPLAKVALGMSMLMERCRIIKQSKTASEFFVDLHPSGRIKIALQYFLEDRDIGKNYVQAWFHIGSNLF